MRLIDADALMADLEKWLKQIDPTHPSEDNSIPPMEDIIVSTLMTIEEQPTVEPQRMRGRWIEDGYNDEKAVCDQCGEPCATYIMGKPRDKYCKWCGAEMGEAE